MRGYFLGNFYLSSIQQGIQAAHCLGEIVIEYNKKSNNKKLLNEWLKYHKTMILLNGGAQRELEITHCLLKQLDLPYACFNEDSVALNNALTCVGFIAPGWLCNVIDAIRANSVISDVQLSQMMPRKYQPISGHPSLIIDFARHIASHSLAK